MIGVVPETADQEKLTLPAESCAPLAGLDRFGVPGDVHALPPVTVRLRVPELVEPHALAAVTNQLSDDAASVAEQLVPELLHNVVPTEFRTE